MNDRSVERHFDQVAADYDDYKLRAHYYYATVKQLLREIVPPGAMVCEVGCGTGDLLAALEPASGLGTDLSPQMVARAAAKHPDLRFAVHDLMTGSLSERFDWVVSVDVAEHVPDLAVAVRSMAGMLRDGGRLVLMTANPGWAPILELAEKLRLKMPEGEHEWRSHDDLERAAVASGLREISFERHFLIPKAVPVLKAVNTAAWARRLRRSWGMIQRAIYER